MKKKVIRIGDKFAMLTILANSGKAKISDRTVDLFECLCDCGNTVVLKSKDLSRVKSCGCLLSKHKIVINPGELFGRLTVENEVNAGKKHTSYLCKCSCGNTSIVSASSLISGGTKSCGCLQKELISISKTKHGMYNTRIYRIWRGIKQRCLNESNKDYVNYGGRGISICYEWLEFDCFYEDMLDGYNDSLTIDRIDNSKGYSKHNCKWSNNIQQSNNKRNNHTVNTPLEDLTLSQVCSMFDLPKSTVYNRFNK